MRWTFLLALLSSGCDTTPEDYRGPTVVRTVAEYDANGSHCVVKSAYARYCNDCDGWWTVTQWTECVALR